MRRTGTSLAEAVVALSLTTALLGAAARGLAHHERWWSERRMAGDAALAADETLAVLRAQLEHASGVPIVLGDTAVQLASLRVVASPCTAVANTMVLPATATAWSAPRAGDSVAVLDTSGAEWRSVLTAVRDERPGSACPGGGTRLVMAAELPAFALWLPARVWRTVRYVAYRGGDGAWWLGERSCAPTCGSAQPATGPLLAPSQGGLRLALVLTPTGRPVALDVRVRARAGTRVVSATARLPLSAAW